MIEVGYRCAVPTVDQHSKVPFDYVPAEHHFQSSRPGADSPMKSLVFRQCRVFIHLIKEMSSFVHT